MLDEYLQKYVDTFDENFPMFAFMSIEEKEIIAEIQKCLDNDKPYVLNVKDGVYL